jgi:hypothetical protein
VSENGKNFSPAIFSAILSHNTVVFVKVENFLLKAIPKVK